MRSKALKTLTVGFFAILFLTGIFLYQKARFNDGKIHIVFCNVGQGDGIFIRTPKGVDILVDGGPDQSILSCLSNHMPFWDREIEVVILTHPHEDHLAGLVPLIKKYKVLSFYTEEVSGRTQTYKEFTKLLKAKNINSKFLLSGSKFSLSDGTSFKILWPSIYTVHKKQPLNVNFDLNGLSVIGVLSFKEFNVLLTGDGGSIVENQIAKTIGDIDILKVPHHGSKTGMDKEFLKKIKPELAVISAGKNNSYGHPAKEMLDLLESFNIKTLRTDIDGEIEVVSDGKNWFVRK
ncbi:MAG: MBL fold metallo-hydrolase [Candidatus Levybacteria bacterium]|nr:MBL fold metallo-hydrolase [Candidatus Levybacteria bacterium]